MLRQILVIAAVVLLAGSELAVAQIPRTFSFQGFLTDASGNPVPDGSHVVLVKLYDAGGTQIFSEVHSASTARGVFNVVIGSVTPLPPTIDFAQQYFLGLSIDGGGELNPRTALTAVPYAIRAEVAAAMAPEAPVVQNLTSSDGSLDVVGPNGPTTSVSIANNGVTSPKLAPASVTPEKINAATAADGDALVYSGGSVHWAVPVARLALPFVDTSGSATPILSIAASSTGTPIVGSNLASTNLTIGVLGRVTSSWQGAGATTGVTGVLGRVDTAGAGGFSAGVRGVNMSTSASGTGVIGYQAGSGWGVYGETPQGYAVYGRSTAATGASIGVLGETFSTGGVGVQARYSGTGQGNALEINNGAIRLTGTNRAAFVHTATTGNKVTANGTDIDNPMCNGDPNAILIATNRLGAGVVYNNSPIGVYYNPNRNKWEIFNENSSGIPVGAMFDVLVIKQ